MRYKLNIKCLSPGDIILVGYNNKISREIQRRTNSKYSHAMLYWYDSIIHASDIVITENPSRMLFDEGESVCILRLKKEYYNDIRIYFLIHYARSLVGTFYDFEALFAMKNGAKVVSNENRQMCAKFVAQCFDYVCLDLVNDYELCTPQDIFNSNLLYPLPDPLIEATQEDIEFANSYDVTKLQFEAIRSFLKSLQRQFPEKDIVSLQQLEVFIKDNPSNGNKILELLKQTKYFDLWKLEKEHCPYLYDVEAFKNKWKSSAVNQAFSVITSCKRIIDEKKGDIQEYRAKITTIGDIEYYRQMIALRENIIEAANERIQVAEQVLLESGIVKIVFPWLS